MPNFRQVIFVLLSAMALAGILSLCLPRPARSQAMNGAECALAADMVLVAAALEQRAAPPELRAALVEDIYAVPLAVPEAAKWRAILAQAQRFARRDLAKREMPAELAGAVAQACVRARGDLSTIFGTEI